MTAFAHALLPAASAAPVGGDAAVAELSWWALRAVLGNRQIRLAAPVDGRAALRTAWGIASVALPRALGADPVPWWHLSAPGSTRPVPIAPGNEIRLPLLEAIDRLLAGCALLLDSEGACDG